tara:strand:+ start:625 stop:1422 length:798 start_codon:yes stop_codon:yes gene_type:complete
MYSGKMVSSSTIIDKVHRDWGLEMSDEQAYEWLAEFMAHTNVGDVMSQRIAYIIICDGRGDLPFDLHKIETVAYLDCIDTLEQAECGEGRITPMRWSSDKFHARYHKDDRDYTTESANTYNVSDNSIFTSFSSGFVAMAYDAIPTDKSGYPMIPGEQQWLEGATHELVWKAARKLWITDSISDKKFQKIEQDRDWYFAQAVNHAKQWHNVDHAESVKNSIVRTIPDIQAHASFFANFQLPEQRNFRGSRTYSSVVRSTQSPSNLA